MKPTWRIALSESSQPVDTTIMDERPGENLDVRAGDEGTASSATGKRWLGIQFDCCDVYSRVYKNLAGGAYVGWCPRCGRKVRLAVGPGGTNARFFRAE